MTIIELFMHMKAWYLVPAVQTAVVALMVWKDREAGAFDFIGYWGATAGLSIVVGWLA